MRHAILPLLATSVLSGCVVTTGEGPGGPASVDLATGEMTSAPANPLDLRRTTLIVADAEASLALYRDALGMTVRYDEELTSPGLERHDADAENRSRLVLMKTNDDFVGGLGLWQFLDRAPTGARALGGGFRTGDVVILFNTEELDRHFAAARAVPGVSVVEEPHLRVYPGPSGDIRVMVSMIRDPDGYTAELNQLLDD